MFMPYGKYQGRPLADVPREDLLWAAANLTSISDELRQAMRAAAGEKEPGPPKSRAALAAENALLRQQVAQLELELELAREARSRGHGPFPEEVQAVVDEFYTRMVKFVHPDRGGTEEAMSVLNNFKDDIEGKGK